jgi:diguanylate cyclase (GGDEF)-like protein
MPPRAAQGCALRQMRVKSAVRPADVALMEGIRTSSSRTHAFWMEHVRLGLGMSSTVIVTIAVYLLLTPDRANRPVMWWVLAASTVVTIAVALLPWHRLVQSGAAMRLMIAWSLSLVPLIVLLATLDGGQRSPMAFLLLLPLVFAAMAYPVRATVGVGAAMVVGQLTIVLSGEGTRPEDLLVQGVILMLIAMMGIIIARNHGRNLQEMEQLAQQLGELAHVDGLTGCLNHRGFRERLDTEVARALRSQEPLGLVHADLDHFKQVNDSFGHPVGDQVLVGVGRALREIARRSDIVARIGGEEFALLLPSTDLAEAARVGERVRAAVGTLERPVSCTVSVGVSALHEVADSEQQLVDTADRALYAAKRSGRDRVVLAPNIREQLAQRARGGLDRTSVADLLEREDPFVPLFQPIVDVTSGAVRGYEALSRVRGSNVAPDRWLAAADQQGRRLDVEVAMWDAALDAFEQAAWADAQPLFLNISPDALMTGSLWSRLDRLPAGTVLEISEHLMVSGSTVMASAVRRWCEAGLRVAIDDLGSGYANLRTVLELEPSFLKLDHSLVTGLDTRERQHAMIGALVTFADQTGTTIIAEGVERDEELDALARLGVPLAQGFGLARPGNPPSDIRWQPLAVRAASGKGVAVLEH